MYTDYNHYLQDMLSLTKCKLDNKFAKEKILKQEKEIQLRCTHTPAFEEFPISHLKRCFALSDFQIHMLLIGLLYDIAPQYEQSFGNWGRKISLPTVYSAAASFKQDTVVDFEEIYPLFCNDFYKTFFHSASYQVNSCWDYPLLLWEDIKNYLLDPQKLWQSTFFEALPFGDISFEAEASFRHVIEQETLPSFIHVVGQKGSGRRYFAACVLAHSNKSIMLAPLSKLVEQTTEELERLMFAFYRGVMLTNTVPCFYADSTTVVTKKEYSEKLSFIFHFAKLRFSYSFFVSEPLEWLPAVLQESTLVQYEIPLPKQQQQITIWETLSTKLNIFENLDFIEITNKFDLTPNEIKTALENAQRISKQTATPLNQKQLLSSCKDCFSHIKTTGTQKVFCSYGWNDIILPPQQIKQLKHACNYIKHAHKVYHTWGFEKKLPYGKNMSLLFEGPPGTGKTMAAQVIAKDLGLDMYKVDISQTVSKYIGETEKNLNRIFNEAEKANVVLFIDEMDAFFGKRTEIKDSHDKYANMETSFLLQKVESYQGILLLATNLANNIDEAFIRRIKFIIHFSRPDANSRLQLWKKAFPTQAPLSQHIDFDFLAENFDCSGGNIKNIALAAAFLAAAVPTSIQMEHILLALKQEMSKMGNILLANDFGKYKHLFLG